MWSEITIRCKKELPSHLVSAFEQRFGKTHDKKETIDVTVCKGDYRLLNQIIYAYNSRDKAYFILNPDISMLKVHIESSIPKDDIRELKKAIDDVTKQLVDFLKVHKNCPNDARAVIYTDNSNHIQTGNLKSWGKMFKDALKNNLFLEIYIPTATFLTSLLFNYNLKETGLNVIVAIFASIIGLIIKVLFAEEKIIYTE